LGAAAQSRLTGWVVGTALLAVLIACWAFGAPPEPSPVAADAGSAGLVVGEGALGNEEAGLSGADTEGQTAGGREVPIVPPPEDFGAPPPAPSPPPAALTAAGSKGSPAPEVWAVMIGVDDYPGSRYDLHSAVADLGDVDQALSQYQVPGDHRLALRNRQVTAAYVLAAADWLVARAGPEDVAVFFYAGHVRRLSAARQAIVAADGRTVVDVDLADRLAGLAAGRTWLVLAACYGGGFDELLGPGRVLTAAAPRDRVAYENEGLDGSYLVHYMVREAMIERRAAGSVQEAFAYASAAIARDYPNRPPVQIDQAGTVIDLQMPGTTSAPVPPAPDPTPAPAPSPAPSPESSPPAPPPEPDDTCSRLTLTVVSCT
jgi:hypothetical protein